MTDYNDLIQGLLDMKTVDFTGTRVAMDAAAAIQGLVAERDRLLLEADPELPTIAYMTGAHDWKVRAEKAEADLGNLLAIILGDGGHYQQECGTDSALKEATELWCAYVSLTDNLKADLAAAREALEEIASGPRSRLMVGFDHGRIRRDELENYALNTRAIALDTLAAIAAAQAEGGE
jgi:hypothetical protein